MSERSFGFATIDGFRDAFQTAVSDADTLFLSFEIAEDIWTCNGEVSDMEEEY